MGTVHIVHDGIEALGGPVTAKALERLWSKKGWRQATDAEVEKFRSAKQAIQEAAANLTVEDLAAVRKRSDLDALALERGIDPTQHDNMDSLRDAVAATL